MMAEVPVPKGCHLLGGQIVIKQPNKQIKKKKRVYGAKFHERKNTGAVMWPLKGAGRVSVWS